MKTQVVLVTSYVRCDSLSFNIISIINLPNIIEGMIFDKRWHKYDNMIKLTQTINSVNETKTIYNKK